MNRFLFSVLIGVAVGVVSGCGGEQPAAAKPVETTQPQASAGAAATVDKGEEVFRKACVLCHKNGEGGAPRLGNKEDWTPRIAQGVATLHDHSISGFTGQKGVMPPKGGNVSLADEDVKAAVDYMLKQVQ